MPKSFLIFVFGFFSIGVTYSQSVVFNPLLKDSIASDSISYSVSGFIELSDSLEFQLELVQVFPDSLHTVYLLKSGFDQNLHPTNNLLEYDSETTEFSLQCGVYNHPDLMVRLLLFRNEEQIYETYFK